MVYEIVLTSAKSGKISRWFTGYDSGYPMQRVHVHSLVGELRLHVPHNVAKNV